MPSKAASSEDVVGEKPFYYACEHGSSNTPDTCVLRVNPDAEAMPDDWYLAVPAGDGVIRDSVNVG